MATADAGVVHRHQVLLSVVIPTWNNVALLASCLRTLTGKADPLGRSAEIIVVDDGSDDGTPAFLAEHASFINTVRHSQRLGFATSCNDGAAQATGEWLVFFNDDAFATLQDLLLLAHLAERAGAAVAGPQLLDGHGGYQDSVGATPSLLSIAATKLGHVLGTELPGASHRRRVVGTRPCGWVSGACLAVRRSAFERVGGFDTSFTYFEDADLCVRLSAEGAKIVATDRVVVKHLGGQSFSKLPQERRVKYARSRRRFLARHSRLGRALRGLGGWPR